MLRELKRHGVVEFERLRSVVQRRVGTDSEPLFLPSLHFLYLLGRVEYHIKNDTIEYKVS
jgi:hypothetical protein